MQSELLVQRWSSRTKAEPRKSIFPRLRQVDSVSFRGKPFTKTLHPGTAFDAMILSRDIPNILVLYFTMRANSGVSQPLFVKTWLQCSNPLQNRTAHALQSMSLSVTFQCFEFRLNLRNDIIAIYSTVSTPMIRLNSIGKALLSELRTRLEPIPPAWDQDHA